MPGQPVMSEDRFRIRNEGRSKDYDQTETRRGLWNSTMAGGVANIWGDLRPLPDSKGSLPYSNANQLLTYARFWKNRFNANLLFANGLTDGRALRESKTTYLFYKEGASSIAMDLANMAGPRFAVAVNTKRDYEEIPLGVLSPSFHTFEAPSQSDWVVAVGGPFPDSSVDVDLGRVDEESGLYRVEPSDGDTLVTEIGGRIARQNEDTETDLYMYFNVVGSFAFEGSQPAVQITVTYFDNGKNLALEYDSASGGVHGASRTGNRKRHQILGVKRPGP